MPASREVSIDALAAAALSAQGKTQIEIAATLELSQSAVSRYLRDVQDYLWIERRFQWDKLEPSVQQEVRRRMSPREITERVARLAKEHDQPAPTVHVVPVGEKQDKGSQFETFAAHAAVELRNLLEDVQGRVGVAWGSTLWHTTQALRAILPQRPLRELAPIEFVPLCGDPLIDASKDQESYADRTSSRIVSDLSEAVNGDKSRPAWLGLVPAYIPPVFTRKGEIQVIDRLIDLVPRYPEIFGPRTGDPPHPPIAGDLHMIITAAGPSKRPRGFGTNALLGLDQKQTQELAENIYGDIGGVLLPRLKDAPGKRGDKSAPHPLVRELTNRWTGLRLEHLKACSARAFSERSRSRPGVTLLCFGDSHVEVVKEAVRTGLVNQLIIGSDLEEALAAALPREGAKGTGERSPALDSDATTR
jgi:DNA-binding transcriptional regulator LsrR (DeoR family)